jgi:hypothetical protein
VGARSLALPALTSGTAAFDAGKVRSQLNTGRRQMSLEAIPAQANAACRLPLQAMSRVGGGMVPYLDPYRSCVLRLM